MGSTQRIDAVPSDTEGPTQYIAPVTTYGAKAERPLFRDEVPEDAGEDTAQFDVRSVQDYDDYDGRGNRGRYNDGSAEGRRKALMVGGFALLLVLVGGGTFFAATQSGGGATAATVADEKEDPGALAAAVLFPETLEIEGASYTRVAVEETEDCTAGAHGDYGQVLADNNCRQLVRASYLSEDESLAVTVGVAAMSTDTDAAAALEAQDLGGSQWFAGLAGEEGSPAERLGHAGGHGSSGQWGRYLVFSLATNSDGSQEDSGDSAEELSAVGEGFLGEAHTRLSEDRA
ncbi:hypothetical protein [Nocardiopsis algeriensis]|uniref:Uncharacterized protein n=1 Tax=Nocardiopsis algeriensis TaxID=1478215 RepID=A0A841IUW2_9ACTN|nr:hypothetical protein [Nocardiopsis algeriensis]MBB6121036.1 hypothetical protein [Nocardiopsis algeriensis]